MAIVQLVLSAIICGTLLPQRLIDAASMAAASDAMAFAAGRDICPGGSFDDAVAAHEMVHTICCFPPHTIESVIER